tara:strand:+ start:7986 stop:9143 length:1158 start_codon:yes stop_codon:yes gene_type:complete
MEGIEINTSLGQSRAEVSSLTSEKATPEVAEKAATVVESEAVAEEVIVDTPIADNNESQPPSVEEKAPELNEDLVRSKAKDLGYLTQEDFESQKQEWLESQQTAVEESDFIKRSRELEAQGYNLNEHSYWDLVTKDYNKYDLNDVNQALDVVLEGYKLDYPNVSEVKLRAKLENDYEALYDDDVEPEDRDHKKAKANLDIIAETYLDKLKDRQVNAKPPMNPEDEQRATAQEEDRRIQTFLPKAEREFKTKINNYFDKNAAYDIKVGEDVIQYEFSKENVSTLNEALGDIFKKDFRLLIDENGSIENRVKDEGVAVTVENLIWQNPELRSGIHKKMLEHNSAQNKKEAVNDLTNASLPSSGAKPNQVDKDRNKDAYSKVNIPQIM